MGRRISSPPIARRCSTRTYGRRHRPRAICSCFFMVNRAAGRRSIGGVGPAASASGKAMLIIHPHLAWGDTFYRYMEVHLVGPGYDLYGAPQIGFPTPVIGFNPSAGWGRTVNTIDTVDFYRLKVKGG